MLAETQTVIVEERSTKKAPLTEAEVRKLLAAVETVKITRGRATEELPARRVKPADLEGPTGNFRAPIVRRGKTLLVGFHPESLAALVG